MIIDIEEYSSNEAAVCDLCVAGSGPAGLAIAVEFLDLSYKVLVVEGGGLEYTEESQQIYQGDVVGHEYFALDETRLRFLGGSSNHWGGWCRPLEDLDFHERSWVPSSGWPIPSGTLEPYLARAHDFLKLGPTQYSPATAKLLGSPLFAFDPKAFVHRFWNQGIPTPQVGELHKEALKQSQNVIVLLNASVKDIVLNENMDRAIAFTVQGREDQLRRIQARRFVVALGGLENPRLLLNANRQIKPGIGNQHDLVGRFFMEHLDVLCGELVAPDINRVTSAYELVARDQGYGVRTAICLTPGAQAQHRVLNQAFEIEGVKARHASPGYLALRRMLRDANEGDFADFAEHLRNMVQDLAGLSNGAYTYVTGREQFVRLEVHSHAEQAPNPESRIRLTDKVDRLGLRRIALDWRTTPLDKRSLRFAVELLAREIGRVGVGRLQIPDWLLVDDDDWGSALEGGHHHMGTTRMASDAGRGVVDPECRLFNIENLYLAGSSVFPVSGTATPTLAIIQLALRLADRLKADLSG
jgi:choline dehydrogenase-like flavoprotein